MRAFLATIALACSMLIAGNASACGAIDHSGMLQSISCGNQPTRAVTPRAARKHERSKRARAYMVPQQITSRYSPGGYHAGPRPARWCGWWMRTQFGGGPEYNRAWAWSKRGYAASAHVGAIVVWRNHVGYIYGRNAKGQWLVKSGNDSNAVRIRPRSLKGAVIRAL